MRILDNGLVEIKNNKTGETRQVHPEELSSYSPLLSNQYSNILAQKKAAAALVPSVSSVSKGASTYLPATNFLQNNEPTAMTVPSPLSRKPDLSNFYEPSTPPLTPEQTWTPSQGWANPLGMLTNMGANKQAYLDELKKQEEAKKKYEASLPKMTWPTAGLYQK